jgi:hypothetical protein
MAEAIELVNQRSLKPCSSQPYLVGLPVYGLRNPEAWGHRFERGWDGAC